MKMTLRLLSILLILPVLASCGAGGGKDAIKIGLSMDTLRADRWKKDRDLFSEKCKQLGAKVLVQSAESNDALQITQAENLLTQGIQALVVIAHNGKSCATIVEMAHKAGVPVLAYDRMILDSDLDMYVSFDSVKVGELMAEYAVKRRPKGNYVLMGGAPTDHNAVLVRRGHENVIRPYVKRGDIRVVGDQWSKDWLAVEALKNMENILTRNANRVDVVLDSYDGTAGGSIQALAEQKLDGKVLVTGQDAELAACQRIVAGTQSMTVYKPIRWLAEKAAEVAVRMAKKETIPDRTVFIHNGKKDVPGILLAPVVVDKDNLADTVLKDGYHKVGDVYRGVPKEQWPAVK